MTLGHKMAAEVSQVRPGIATLIGCPICAMGIAIDAVGDRYGFAAYEDWACAKPDCPIRANGVPADKLTAVRAVIATLAAAGDAVAPAGQQTIDTRLPPEREDASGDLPF